MSRTRPARLRRAAVLPAVALVLALAGCGASTPSDAGSPTPGTPTPGTPTPSAVPAGGVSLAMLGLTHGPAGFSVPADVVVTTASDQPQTVTLVLSRPSTADLEAYLTATLPAAGFAVTGRSAQGEVMTLAFTGRGWQGTFTGTGALSGITLSRAP